MIRRWSVSWLERYRPLDRYWPLGLIGAAGIAIVFVASPIWSSLSRAVPAWELSSIVSAFILPGVWALVALFVGMFSLDARVHALRRAEALTGNTAAVPLSLFEPDPARAPDVSHEPLALLWRQAPAFLANPTFGVIATGDGLIWRRLDRPDQLVRWEEARLLEVTSRQTSRSGEPMRTYTLYGGLTRAEWQEYRSSAQSFVPDRISRDHMVIRQRLLLDLIAARTGLSPRTFEPALRSEDELVSRPEKRWVVFASECSLVLVSMSLALAAEAVLLPLTTFPAINVYVAITLALAGLSLLIAASWSIIRQWRGQRRVDRYVLPPAPSWETPDNLFAMSTKASWILRLELLSLGLLLSLNGTPLVLAFVAPAYIPQMKSASVLFLILFWVFLGGVVGFVSGLMPGATVVVADQLGVSKRKGRKAETIPWEEVECVVAHVSGDQARSFDVVGHGGAFTLTWETRNIRLTDPPAGAQGVTPEGMAEMVVARSSAPLRIQTSG
jgi:hypothetical protein